MISVKEQAQKALGQLPDDCTFEDIQYELYVLEKIRRAEQSIHDDGGVTQEEAKRRMSAWLSQ